MKIFVLTDELTEKNGYGRYSLGLSRALREAGIELVFAQNLPNPLSFKKNYFLAFWHAWKLKKGATNCDIIHSFIEPYSYITYLLSKFVSKKYFITVHGTYGVLPFSFPFYKRYFHKKSFENAEKIICVSNYTKKRMEEFGLGNLVVINNGIDYQKFHSLSDDQIENRENFILSVGALKYRKGYHISIPAFAQVKSKFKDLKYYIVGDQNDPIYFNHLKKIISDLDIQDSVVFLKSIPDKELISLYKKARLFILTPVSEGLYFEGFGLVYLEANVCGLPVIGTLDTGAEDAIKNQKTGVLVPQGDITALSKIIAKVLKDSNLAEKMSKEGIRWSKEHDWEKIIPGYIEVYNQTK